MFAFFNRNKVCNKATKLGAANGLIKILSGGECEGAVCFTMEEIVALTDRGSRLGKLALQVFGAEKFELLIATGVSVPVKIKESEAHDSLRDGESWVSISLK